MKPTHPYLVELNRFMVWFKAGYPELFEAYKENFDLPLKRGGKITVNNRNRINDVVRKNLIEIARNYYKQPAE